jgi:hypothetical protein
MGARVNGFERLQRIVEESPLSRSMPAVLSAATLIDCDELAAWTRLELIGYYSDNPAMTDAVVVPEYRAVAGNWYDDFGRMFLIDDANLNFVNQLRLRQGVAELEGFATATGPLAVREIDIAAIIRETLKVNVTTFEFPVQGVSQVLANIKVHALDRIAAEKSALAEVVVPELKAEGELLQLRPGFHGVSVDLKVLWRRLFGAKSRP